MRKLEMKENLGVARRMAYVAPQVDVFVMGTYQLLAGTNNGFGGGAGEGDTPIEYGDDDGGNAKAFGFDEYEEDGTWGDLWDF